MAGSKNPIEFGTIGYRFNTSPLGRPDLGNHRALRNLFAEICAYLEKSVMLAERKAIIGRHIERHGRASADLTFEDAGMNEHIADSALGDCVGAR